jgi:hypothetical protein
MLLVLPVQGGVRRAIFVIRQNQLDEYTAF